VYMYTSVLGCARPFTDISANIGVYVCARQWGRAPVYRYIYIYACIRIRLSLGACAHIQAYMRICSYVWSSVSVGSRQVERGAEMVDSES